MVHLYVVSRGCDNNSLGLYSGFYQSILFLFLKSMEMINSYQTPDYVISDLPTPDTTLRKRRGPNQFLFNKIGYKISGFLLTVRM